MATMLCLAMSMLVMTVEVTREGKGSDLLPLSFCITLIFGLPALRNAQPGVPPLGALGDYFSFIWAELIVAACAVVTIWIWLVRSHQKLP